MYVAVGQGQTTHRGQNFDVKRNLLSNRSFATSFKKISLKSDFIHVFFHDFIHVYSPRAEAYNPLRTKFLCQQEHLVTSVICYKFPKNLFEVWFYTHFFMILHMYTTPLQGQTTPWGQNFDVNRNILSFQSFVISFKNVSLKLYAFIQILLIISYTYIAPGAGADNPLGTKFWCQQKHLVTLVICYKFKKNPLLSPIIYTF